MFRRFRLIKPSLLPISVCGVRLTSRLSTAIKEKKGRRHDGRKEERGDGRMSRLKAEEEGVSFQRGVDVLSKEEAEMGQEGPVWRLSRGFTSETSEMKKKKKNEKTNHWNSRADGMNLEIYVVYQKLHQQRLWSEAATRRQLMKVWRYKLKNALRTSPSWTNMQWKPFNTELAIREKPPAVRLVSNPGRHVKSLSFSRNAEM